MNIFWFILDLLGHFVIAHFGKSRSILAYSQNLSILFSWVWGVQSLFIMAAKSSTYAAKLMVILNVPNVYPFFLLCNHLNSGSRNIMNR